MRALIQRVSSAGVTVEGAEIAAIANGLLVLLGVSVRDEDKDVAFLVEKTLNLRIFEDDSGKMNLSLLDTGGELLVVSQFTLYGDVRRGRRPSFVDAAEPEKARRLYELFVSAASLQLGRVASGEFQAMMDVKLVNNGPVTIMLDSETKYF